MANNNFNINVFSREDMKIFKYSLHFLKQLTYSTSLLFYIYCLYAPHKSGVK